MEEENQKLVWVPTTHQAADILTKDTGLVDPRQRYFQAVARGGRYDELVRRCGARPGEDFGAGFSLAIDPIRELLNEIDPPTQASPTLMVAFSQQSTLEAALKRQRWWHQQGRSAVIELHPFNDRSQAEQQANDQGGFQLDWIDL